jgi:rhodanese-related sulfurtransferase
MENKINKAGPISQAIIKLLMKSFEVPTISRGELKTGLADGTMRLIDVRTDREREEFDIGGEHIEMDKLLNCLDLFQLNFIYVFYCSSGKRSAEAVRLLKDEKPMISALSLQGGVGEWVKYMDL